MMVGSVSQGVWSLISAFALTLMLPSGGSFDKEDIHFGRFYKAATQTSKRALREIFFITFYRVYVRPLETWPTNLRLFCTEVLGWSNRKFRESFNVNERSKLEESVESADYDLSLLSKMFNKFFEDVNLSDPLLRAVRDIKNVRNRVCHEQFSVDEADLRDNMEDLQQILGSLFDEAAKFFDMDLEDVKQIYIDEVDDIKSAPITGQAVSYFENLEKFREDLVGKFITHGRKELMDFYSKLRILNPFTWLSDDKFPEMLVDKVFTPLYIREQERTIDMSTLLTTEVFNEAKQVSLGILPSVLILSGIAGCGKTSLCRYMLHVWRTRTAKINGLRSVDILIFVEIRNVTESSLVSYLQKTLLRETCSYFDEKEILLTLQKMNILFVIDGMDEAADNAKSLVEEIFSTLGTARVIITTRPEFISVITQSALRHHLKFMKLRIQGFTKEGIKCFTSKILTESDFDEKRRHQFELEFRRFLKTTGASLGDHLKLPLTVALLIMLWKDNKQRIAKISNATTLYYELFRLCTMKLIGRLQSSTPLHHVELEDVINDWLMLLAEEAFDMLESGSFTIGHSRKQQLYSFCRKQNIDSIQTLSAFLVCEVQEGLGGTDYSFSFIHKSQMEYLASLHVTQKLLQTYKVKPKNIFKRLSYNVKRVIRKNPSGEEDYLVFILQARRWWNTVLFTLGQLCKKTKVSENLLFDLLEILTKRNNHDASIMWRIIQESGCHPLVCKEISDCFGDDFIWKPDCESFCDPVDPMTMLIRNTEFSPSGILLRVVNSTMQGKVALEDEDTEGRPNVNLFPILRCLSQRPCSNVVLRLDQHYYEWGNKESSNDVLTALLPGGKLTAFMGHLGLEGAKALATVQDLGEVFIRITDYSTLNALDTAFRSRPNKKVENLTLRIDVPWRVSPHSLPKISTPCKMSIILRDVSDETQVQASDLVVRISSSYEEVDLVSSTLSPVGGMKFLKSLVENGVSILSKVTIRSAYSLAENDYREIKENIKYTVEWLW